MLDTTNLSKSYVIFWLLTIILALLFMFYLQGDYLDLYVSDQFYYFENLSLKLEAFSSELDPRYYFFMAFLKLFKLIISDQHLIYFFYVLINGVILMILCQKFKNSHILFFSASYIYLSHGMLRDQLILSLAPLLCKSRFFLVEIMLASLRVQLLLLIDYRHKILNLIIPFLFLSLAVWYSTNRNTFSAISLGSLLDILKSFSIFMGIGFLTIDKELPLIYVLIRMVLGTYLLIFLAFQLIKKNMQLIFFYKYLLLILCYVTLGIPIDIRVHITAIALSIVYFEKAR